MVVSPGDWIMGDDDGVAVIPRARLEEIVAAAAAVEIKEAKIAERILAGEMVVDILNMRDTIYPKKG